MLRWIILWIVFSIIVSPLVGWLLSRTDAPDDDNYGSELGDHR